MKTESQHAAIGNRNIDSIGKCVEKFAIILRSATRKNSSLTANDSSEHHKPTGNDKYDAMAQNSRRNVLATSRAIPDHTSCHEKCLNDGRR